jgi:hypothetical protein
MAIAPRGSWDAAVRRWCARWFSLAPDGNGRAIACAPVLAWHTACAARWPADDLLARRMQAMHINSNELARLDPFAFRELQELCSRCQAPAQCARDLDDEFTDPGWEAWRDYCPNATALSVLSTLDSLEARVPVVPDGTTIAAETTSGADRKSL